MERLLKSYLPWMDTKYVMKAITDNYSLYRHNNIEERRNLQEDIIRTFNRIFVLKLENKFTETKELLYPIKEKASRLCLGNFHINSSRWQKLINEYLLTKSDSLGITDFNEDIWKIFVANINYALACLDLILDIDEHYYVRNRLKKRYQNLNKLLEIDRTFDRRKILDLRAPEIMVGYTISYFSVYMARELQILRELSHVFASNLFQSVAEKVDILVRILNDIGYLAFCPTELIPSVFTELERLHLENTSQTSSIVLLFEYCCEYSGFSSSSLRLIQRLAKDFILGEDNIVRDYCNLSSERSVIEELAFIQESVLYYSRIYQATKEEFFQASRELTQVLKLSIFSKLAENFVFFHEQIYQQDFRTMAGDYAV